MRAVTVQVDSISAVAGFIFPGDRVDILLAHNVPQTASNLLEGERGGAGNDTQVATTAEILIPNIRVLAVNDRKPPPPPAPAGQEQNAQPQQPENTTPQNVTVALTQEEAKKLRLAEKNGTLSLALRSMQDMDDEAVGLPVTLVDLSRVEGGVEDLKGWKKTNGTDERRREQMNTGVIIIRGVTAQPGTAFPSPLLPTGER